MGAVKPKRALVIGGVNMDIGGSPVNKLIMRDSNPGIITARPGGVGRNIAHDMSLLGLEVSLIAAIGDDVYGHGILTSCAELGLDLSLARVLPDMRTSTYLYVTDETGDMELAISDMEIVKCITPDYVARHIEAVNSFDAVVLDANLEAETIEYVAAHCTAPIYADPVSTAKALRFLPVLDKLTALKPNIYEAERLTGEIDPERAARKLVEHGVKRVFISLGEEGILAADENELLKLPREYVTVVNTTGAGDAATAAIVWAGLNGLSLYDSALAAVKAGAITSTCVAANNPELSADKLR